MKKYFFYAFLIIFILFIGNCTTPTEPNHSVIYQIQPLNIDQPVTEKQNIKPVEIPTEIQEYLIDLYNIDAELAIEIGRLPEIQHEMSPNTKKAFKRFVNLVENATEDEISKFKAVINEGIPEVRKFCTLLQATIWYLEKDKIIDSSELFNWDYRRILWESWGFGSDSHC
jgi:hypothetical protein